MGLLDNYAFNEFYQRLIHEMRNSITKQDEKDKYNRICVNGFRTNSTKPYAGDQNCRHNVARAL